MMSPDTPRSKLLTVNEVAEWLRVDPDTIRRWLRSGALTGVKVGGLWRVEHDEVLTLLEEGMER